MVSSPTLTHSYIVLFVILLLGFYLVANMSRWRRADAESGLSAGSHAATDNHVNCFRRWRKSSSVYSVYDASLHSESYTQHSGGSQGRALPLERQPTHKADRRHSKSSVSTFSVTSAKSADGYITEREGQVGAPSPPEPVMHRARTSHVSHAYGPSS